MTTRRRVELDSTTAWEAVRAAGGSVSTAAGALGISARDLIELLRADPPMRLGIERHKTSGLRRRVVTGSDDESSGGDSP